MRLSYFVVLLSASSLLGQELTAPSFPKPAYFRHTFSTPKTRVELQPPVRLRDFVVDGKLELSLRDYLDLVMANNTEIAIARLTVETPKNNVMAAFGKFDPTLSLNFNAQRSLSPATRSLIEGGTEVSRLSHRGGVTFSQLLPTGTQVEVSFNDTRNSSNDARQDFNPAHSGSFGFNFRQPLLRNRGIAIQKMQITIAQNNLRRSEFDFRDTLANLIQQAESAYWDVVEARETLRVQEESLKVKEESLKRSERELELGAISALDIFQPRADYATAEIQVSQQRFVLAQREDALRRMIGADLDPDVRNLPIVLTESVTPPADDRAIDPEEAVQKALANRPDLKALAVTLDTDDLNIKTTMNQLRPDLSLTASYTSSGVNGQRLVNGVPMAGTFGDFFSNVFSFNYPTYQFGLTLSLPIRDRANTAELANRLIAKKSDALRMRNLEQNIRLNVLNAVNSLESAKAGVKLAQVSVELARNQLDAEQKKYDLGTTQFYFVLNAQDRLNAAQLTLVRQTLNYHRNRLALLRQTGELLEERGIVVK
ncbi:MAG TPA: TolC family protein [Bryobacteraceae bacterium]|nr:TolC family protein [Bryobacteraceae bacterium]HOQ47483.1 TolC family protein [Bryobacteraceae bacterium]HPQ15247.1 TolC family protein [Bryobacteraceae bacterium]HPU73198.1 TolC family protein [Bryobacteraceae bacterium]